MKEKKDGVVDRGRCLERDIWSWRRRRTEKEEKENILEKESLARDGWTARLDIFGFISGPKK